MPPPTFLSFQKKSIKKLHYIITAKPFDCKISLFRSEKICRLGSAPPRAGRARPAAGKWGRIFASFKTAKSPERKIAGSQKAAGDRTRGKIR